MGLPIVIAANGRGLPIVEATNGYGMPVTIAENGFGLPVVYTDNGRGLPVVTSDPDASVVIGDWVAGPNATYTTDGTRARATQDTGSNPRISKQVTGLTPGVTYRVVTNVYIGTSNSVFWRVSLTQGLINGDLVNDGPYTVDTPINVTFVAPASGEVYMGPIGVIGTGGFVETDQNFTLTRA